MSWAPAVRTALEGSGYRVRLLTLGECPAPLLPTWRRIVGVPAAEAAAAWQRGTVAALQQVAPHAGRTVLLGAPPRSGDLQTCVTGRSRPSACVQPLPAAWSAVTVAEAAAARAAGVVHVDPSPWFCHDGRCPAVIDGTPVLWDGSHLTAAYARRLGPLLGPLLLGAG